MNVTRSSVIYTVPTHDLMERMIQDVSQKKDLLKHLFVHGQLLCNLVHDVD